MTKGYFDVDFNIFKIKYIKWYDCLWLWFLQTHMVEDGGNILFYKAWKDRIYILGMSRYK